ncbi:MAG: NADH-quinone oxidoreductase subunit C [Syntrophorhabdus sp. PtaU1.Bin058]|nr:MAG: NADH-quinone oxidoreductase subunit C [Syntrophorhabdus sp. PtaU1.Bin058]
MALETRVIEEFRSELRSVDINEAPYDKQGYHLAIEARTGNLQNIVDFFDKREFYIVDLFCVDYQDYLELVYFFNTHRELCRIKVTLKLDPEKPVAPTISNIYPMASWYEREVHEFFGVYFEGHPNLTYLFLHDGIDHYPLRKKHVPVPDEDKKLLNSFKPQEEEDCFFINLGPQHPSTHGVLRVVLKMDGEYIISADPVLGYLHRMHEKMAEKKSYAQFLPNPARMDYPGALLFNLAHVETVEKLCGIEVPERAKYIRTITCELNRIASHLLWLGSFPADLGGLTPFLYAFDDRENILDILEDVTGSRLTYCYFRFGGLYNDINEERFVSATKRFVERMRKRFDMYDKLITGNVIFINRITNIGIMEQAMIRKYGASGPFTRSTGIPFDMRKVDPYAAYGSIDFEIPTGHIGDNMDRYRVRMKEMEISLNIIEEGIKKLPQGPFKAEKVPKKLKPPKGDIYNAVESTRGETGVYIVSDESDTPYRMRWRVPSFSNLMTFPYLAQGVLIADAIATLGSYDIVVPEMDR